LFGFYGAGQLVSGGGYRGQFDHTVYSCFPLTDTPAGLVCRFTSAALGRTPATRMTVLLASGIKDKIFGRHPASRNPI
jgi:hypothetical protein